MKELNLGQKIIWLRVLVGDTDGECRRYKDLVLQAALDSAEALRLYHAPRGFLSDPKWVVYAAAKILILPHVEGGYSVGKIAERWDQRALLREIEQRLFEMEHPWLAWVAGCWRSLFPDEVTSRHKAAEVGQAEPASDF